MRSILWVVDMRPFPATLAVSFARPLARLISKMGGHVLRTVGLVCGDATFFPQQRAMRGSTG